MNLAIRRTNRPHISIHSTRNTGRRRTSSNAYTVESSAGTQIAPDCTRTSGGHNHVVLRNMKQMQSSPFDLHPSVRMGTAQRPNRWSKRSVVAVLLFAATFVAAEPALLGRAVDAVHFLHTASHTRQKQTPLCQGGCYYRVRDCGDHCHAKCNGKGCGVCKTAK